MISKLVPTKLELYEDNGRTYIKYTGQYQTADGSIFECTIPKMTLDIDCDGITFDYDGRQAHFNQAVTIYRSTDEDEPLFIARRLYRKVSKQQLEKELGYKLEIAE